MSELSDLNRLIDYLKDNPEADTVDPSVTPKEETVVSIPSLARTYTVTRLGIVSYVPYQNIDPQNIVGVGPGPQKFGPEDTWEVPVTVNDEAREVTPPRTYPLDEVVRSVCVLGTKGERVVLQLIADGSVRWDRG